MQQRNNRQPALSSGDAQLSDLPPLGSAQVRGLDAFPQDDWPDNIPLLYYSYHIMVGLGTFFIAIMVVVGLSAVARQTFQCALDALDSHALSALSLTSPTPPDG